MSSRVIIEIPLDERIWRVTFGTSPSDWSGAAHADDGGRQRFASFRFDEEWEMELDALDELPKGEAWELWFLRGIFRDYLRNTREFLGAALIERVYGRDHQPLFNAARGGTHLERAEREIEEALFRVGFMRGWHTQQQNPLDAPDWAHVSTEEWKRTEVWLRDRDEHAAIAEFYTALPPLGVIMGPPSPKIDALGFHALEVIRRGRDHDATGRRQGIDDGTRYDPWPADEPVHLHELAITNIRCFRDVRLHIPPPIDGKGQWIVLLGDNGTGKSTILRALALALLRPPVAAALLTRSSGDASFVRASAANGRAASIEVTFNDTRARAALTRSGDLDELKVAHAPSRWPLVFAYGCRRGSALGGLRREAEPDPVEDADTLFDETASLIHAESWLRELHHQAQLDPARKPFYEAVKEVVLGVLPGVEQIHIEADATIAEGPRIGRVPIAALSDGYLTTMGWVVDFIARWTAHARRIGLDLDERFRDQMACVVLVDELDLHLHPRWQKRVIADLREAFPVTTFVTTTHNPLTLLGTCGREGEVYVLRMSGDGHTELDRRDLPPGLRADQVLTGAWFGLDDALVDPELSGKLAQHRRMLAEGRAPDDAERLAVEAELREHLGYYGSTRAERLAQEIVAGHFAARGEDEEITDEDREALQQLYAQRVAEDSKRDA